MAKLGFEPRYVQQQSTCSLYSVILASFREKASLRNWKTKRSIQSGLFSAWCCLLHRHPKRDQNAPKEDRTKVEVLEDRPPAFSM